MPIRADVSGLNKLARELALAGERGRKELSRATIDMRRRSKPEANRAIRKDYTVKVAPINARLKVESDPAEFAVTLGVTAEDKRRRVPVVDFNGTRVTPAGVRVKLLRANPPTVVPRSFQGAGKIKDRLVRRSGEKRFPLQTIGGFTAQAMLFERRAVIEAVIQAVLLRASKDVAKRIARLEKK